MSSFKRKITYFYEHHKENVGSTAGFLKLEIRGDKVKINISIQEPMGLPYHGADLYFYHEAGDHLSAVYVGRVEQVNGMLTYQDRTDWQNMYGLDRDLYTFDGVAVVYNDTHYYIGDFEDKSRREYPLLLKREPVEANHMGNVSTQVENEETKQGKGTTNQTYRPQLQNAQMEHEVREIAGILKAQRPETDTKDKALGEETPPQNGDRESWYENISSSEETLHLEERMRTKQDRSVEGENRANVPNYEAVNHQEKMGVFEQCKNCPYQKKRKEQQENKSAFEKMIAEYPKLPMYGAAELFDCVRIHPRDIGKLDMRNWKLGVNSFLTHGFYTYQYLLLGKMRFDNGRESPIIGVPGVFSNRDKYLANMFGFEQFIPVKKTGTKTGEFGYWIVEIQ